MSLKLLSVQHALATENASREESAVDGGLIFGLGGSASTVQAVFGV